MTRQKRAATYDVENTLLIIDPRGIKKFLLKQDHCEAIQRTITQKIER